MFYITLWKIQVYLNFLLTGQPPSKQGQTEFYRHKGVGIQSKSSVHMDLRERESK